MTSSEVEALRKAADEVWEIAKKLDSRGFREAAETLRDACSKIHEKARLSSIPPH